MILFVFEPTWKFGRGAVGVRAPDLGAARDLLRGVAARERQTITETHLRLVFVAELVSEGDERGVCFDSVGTL